MIKEGSIELWRELLDWPYHKDAKMMSLWVHILLMAAFADHEWNGTTIRRGQLLTTVSQLAEITGLTPKEVRIRLDRLEKDKEIGKEKGKNGAKKRTKNGTIITVCKYDDYQVLSGRKGQNKGQEDGQNKRQKKGQLHNTNNTDKDSFTNVQESTLSHSASAEFLKFLEWINTHAAEVAKMKQPFTEDQYRDIQQNYEPREVADVLEAMSNTANLTKKYVSAYKTCKSWLKLRKDGRGGRASGGTTKSKINTENRLNANDEWER